jgi:RNA polymerase sigma factor (sigma-70 family)
MGIRNDGRFDGQTCPGCNGKKSESWRLCRECFAKYGRKSSDWPKWLQEQVSDDRRIRYEAKRKGQREISLDAFATILEQVENANPGRGDRFIDHIITARPLAISRRPKGDPWWPETDYGWTLLLPWAPYTPKGHVRIEYQKPGCTKTETDMTRVDALGPDDPGYPYYEETSTGLTDEDLYRKDFECQHDQTQNEPYRKSNGIVGRASGMDYLNRLRLAQARDLITPDPQDEFADIEHFEAVTTGIEAALTNRQQEILALYLEHGNQDDVAQELGINQSTVSRHWKAAVGKIEEIGKRYA